MAEHKDAHPNPSRNQHTSSREHARLPSLSEVRGIFLVILGCVSLVYYYSWWLQDQPLASPWHLFGLIVALAYGTIQLLFSWVIYLATHRRRRRVLVQDVDLSVDIFVTTCGESKELVHRTLTAACAIRGNHRTWLLDDGKDPELAQIATQLGAGYLTRDDRKGSKSGNINAALARTNGEIIAMFDVDHAPLPMFLEQTLGYFSDPATGFVQVMLTFENDDESWIAHAATETSYDYYNPISIGADGIRGTSLVGSNSLIRRKALESIGGYRPGLADDLETSIALHANRWESYYVDQPLAPGYAPPDLTAWFTQQFKWARGVFETLLTSYPRNLWRLRSGQRFFYPVRLTYYWLGTVICIHLLATLYALLSMQPEFLHDFEQYLLHFLPLALIGAFIRILALRRWRHPSLNRSLQWKPVVLVFFTWPVYTTAWIMALLRIPLRYRPTPKAPTGSLNLLWITVQIVTTLLLLCGLGQTGYLSLVGRFDSTRHVLTLGFAGAQAAVQAIPLAYLLHAWLADRKSKRATAEEAGGGEVTLYLGSTVPTSEKQEI